MTEQDTNYWVSHIARSSRLHGNMALTQWQEEYNDYSLKELDTSAFLQENFEHYKNLEKKSDCVWVVKELKKSEKDFEDACLVYWKNTKKDINSAINDIGKAFAVYQMRLWLVEQKSKAGSIAHDGKSQSLTASMGQILETDKYDIIILDKVLKSYNEFNNDLFEMNFGDYLACFNLSKPEPTHPKFNPGQQTNFVYFLSQIPDVKNMDKIALSRFGIKNYYQQKGKAKPGAVFKARVVTIFK